MGDGGAAEWARAEAVSLHGDEELRKVHIIAAAEQGHVLARAICAYHGYNEFPDTEKAIELLTGPAAAGDPAAMRILGVLQSRNGELETAFDLFRRASEAGDVRGMFNYARSLRTGEGVAGGPNLPAALVWFRRGAENGDVKAMVAYGAQLQSGGGLDDGPDDDGAVLWLRRAADLGSATAEFALSVSYRQGRGVEHSEALSLQHLRTAADKGYTPAMFNLALRYQRGVGIGRDIERSTTLFHRAADDGLSTASYALARSCHDRRDPEAVEWLRKACESNSPVSQDWMARSLAPCRCVSPPQIGLNLRHFDAEWRIAGSPLAEAKRRKRTTSGFSMNVGTEEEEEEEVEDDGNALEAGRWMWAAACWNGRPQVRPLLHTVTVAHCAQVGWRMGSIRKASIHAASSIRRSHTLLSLQALAGMAAFRAIDAMLGVDEPLLTVADDADDDALRELAERFRFQVERCEAAAARLGVPVFSRQWIREARTAMVGGGLLRYEDDDSLA